MIDAIEGWADYGRYAAALDPLHYLHEDQVTALMGQTLSHGRPGRTNDWPMRSLLDAGPLRQSTVPEPRTGSVETMRHRLQRAAGSSESDD